MRGGATGERRRTENDMSMSVVLFGSLGLLALLAVFLWAEVGPLPAIAGAVLVLLFGFLFVTVSARLTGEIGSSSNPISGMTTATLMLTCLIFLALGWQSSTYRLLALSVAAVVCIASSNGGTTAQSLKTGFLVGATPRLMQYAILIGALISGLVIGATLIAFNESRVVVTSKEKHVPKHALTKTEMDRLSETAVHENKTYKVWHTGHDVLKVADDGFVPRDETKELTKGQSRTFYVDPDSGKLAYLKDPTIMGKVDEKDDGTYAKREFDAPKTQVLGIVINGVLAGELNWSMIAIGAMIAFMLELCGVSALAFAVGLYVPLAVTSPIFVGGIVRYLVDRYLARQAAAEAAANMERALAVAGDDPAARMRAEVEAKAQAEIDAIRKSETSGGVLLASGFIAGGSLAALVLAFMAFHDDWPDDLRLWEHQKYSVQAAKPLSEAARDAALAQFGVSEQSAIADPELAKKVDELGAEIAQLSKSEPFEWATVPQGSVLKMPRGQPNYTAEREMPLRDVAREIFGRERYAQKIFEKNKDEPKTEDNVPNAVQLKLPERLPAGAELSLPSKDLPAWLAFGALALFLLLVGIGKLLTPPPAENGNGNGTIRVT